MSEGLEVEVGKFWWLESLWATLYPRLRGRGMEGQLVKWAFDVSGGQEGNCILGN